MPSRRERVEPTPEQLVRLLAVVRAVATAKACSTRSAYSFLCVEVFNAWRRPERLSAGDVERLIAWRLQPWAA